VRARIGKLALRASTVPEAERIRVIGERLPVHEWPERALRITAVDAHTGEFVVFDRDAGAPLVEAVAASCAVPGSARR
jgi:NTE family protein